MKKSKFSERYLRLKAFLIKWFLKKYSTSKNFLAKRFLGKYHNLWTLPLAFLIAYFQDYVAIAMGWATFTPEKISKIIPAMVVFLLADSFIRIYYILQYPNTYHYANIGENKGWKECSEKEKFSYSFWQRLFYLAVFAVFVWAM